MQVSASRSCTDSRSVSLVDWLTPPACCNRVPVTTQEEMSAVVASAVAAQKKWRDVPVQQRTRVLIKFQTLLVANKEDIAMCMVAENGKTKVDAIGDITRGIEVVEHCLAMPSLMMGEAVEQIRSKS